MEEERKVYIVKQGRLFRYWNRGVVVFKSNIREFMGVNFFYLYFFYLGVLRNTMICVVLNCIIFKYSQGRLVNVLFLCWIFFKLEGFF